jgi:hypothetical protein
MGDDWPSRLQFWQSACFTLPEIDDGFPSYRDLRQGSLLMVFAVLGALWTALV